jgi:signal transduction histidine kinase
VATPTLITRRYLRLRTFAALCAVFVSAMLAHELGDRGAQAVGRAAAVAEALDRAHLAVAETALALRELAAAGDPQRAETRRAELRRTAEALGSARAALGAAVTAGALGRETEAVLAAAALDPAAALDDLGELAATLGADDAPFGAAAERPAFAGLSLARQLLPLLTRLKDTERAALARATGALSDWGAGALALTGLLLVGLWFVAFLPVERRILSAQREIEEKRRVAEQASEAKSAFLATMSHEIRTPMNGVLGMADLLRASGLDPRQKRMAEIIATSGRALMAILDQVLQFSRIEQGRLTLNPAPFDLGALAEDTAALFQPLAEAKGLALTVRIDPSLPRRLIGDDGALRQVLTNLLANAVKFTETGRVSLTVADQGPVRGGRRAIAITVRDTGIGIAPEAQARIFDSFVQADASSTRRFGGAGLGLAISRGLVGAIGGDIGVDSAPGTGSAFTVRITLPVAEAPALAEARAASTLL